MFTIRVYYSTGDSFHTEETSDTVGYSWSDIKALEESIKRIRAHGNWSNEDSYQKQKDPIDQKWFNNDAEDHYEKRMYVICVDDDLNPIKLQAFWYGYFEHFQEAKAEIDL